MPKARNVFISFRFSDGQHYKERMSALFDERYDTVDFSEDEDRSRLSESGIKSFLYSKLKRSSVTIILLTPQAIQYKRNYLNQIDDWIYDEVRYSLEDRDGNRTNGLIAVYVPEAAKLLMAVTGHKCSNCSGYNVTTIFSQENLFRYNMMNVKPFFKQNNCEGVFDSDYDSYCSLVSFDDFIKNPTHYIEIAIYKRENIDHYNLVKKL